MRNEAPGGRAGAAARRAAEDQAAAGVGWSVPQYLHLRAGSGRSLDKQAGPDITRAAGASTVAPRRAWVHPKGTAIPEETNDQKTLKKKIKENKPAKTKNTARVRA